MLDLNKFKHRTFCDGKIIMINADCLDVMQEIGDRAIDLVLTDPPYNTTACKFEWDIFKKIEFFWESFNLIAKNAMIFTGSNPFSAKLICSNLAQYKYNWVWDKVSGANFMNLKNQPLKNFEDVMVFSKNANFTFNPKKISRTKLSLKRDPVGSSRVMKQKGKIIEHYNSKSKDNYIDATGLKHPTAIIQFSKRRVCRDGFTHPTSKPVSLIQYLVETYSNENDLIFDAFAGSFTTAIACIKTKRKFIGCELDKTYFEKAVKRVETELKQGILF